MAERWVTAESIRRNIGADVVKTIVDSQIEIIDDAILSANSAGGNMIEYDLPIGPVVAGLPRAQAEAVIYSEILQVYEQPIEDGGKGFEHVYIKHVGNRVLLRIEWENVLSQDEYNARVQYLKDHKWTGKKK